MKLEVPQKLYERMLNTKAGKLASLLDDMLYNAREDGEKLVLSKTTFDSHAVTELGQKGVSRETRKALREIEDLLFQTALEELEG
jgi:hypothetical protein